MRKSTMISGKNTPISAIYGIGEKRAALFSKLGINNAGDLVYYFPRGYENRGNIKTVEEVEDGEVCSLELTVSAKPKSVLIKRGMTLTKLSGFDETGKCSITYFNQPYMDKALVQGETYRFYGKIEKKNRAVFMSSPIADKMSEADEKSLYAIYPLTSELSQKIVHNAIESAFKYALDERADDCVKDVLPADMKKKYGLCDLRFALENIHNPINLEGVNTAKRRLAFEEMYLFALNLLASGKAEKQATRKAYAKADMKKFESMFGFTFTNAQKRTIGEIEEDLTSGKKMSRIVTGDVGSGKTVCAAFAVFSALENGEQAAIMAPTEILARQHYNDLKPLFEKIGYKTEILTGGMKASEKRSLLEKIYSGDVRLIIGTHALLESNVLFNDLGLVVTDEQHKFGANQRKKLAEKNFDCHILTMSATPIPRTLALVLFGNLDISTVDEMPPGRKKVSTFALGEDYRDGLNGYIRKTVDEGGQVYIVCPSVEEEKLVGESGEEISQKDLIPLGVVREGGRSMKAAVNFADELSEKVFPDLRIGFIHGKLKQKQKDEVMERFVKGELDILVSTTVIEVGVNVPNASVMVVENAEFFGLAQLHQLRGRVGRGSRKSYCFLMSDSKSEKAKERLQTLCETNDGYKIAEKDLEMRGPGDFIAQTDGTIRQSGESGLKLSASLGNSELIYHAFEEAKNTISSDPHLLDERNRAAKEKIGETKPVDNVD